MGKLILIVDDSAELLELFHFSLSQAGYEVITAEDGKQALSLIANKRPDLIISDVMMPNMGGFEFVKNIRNDHSLDNVPILIMSTKEEAIGKSIALDVGANGYLVKPVKLEVIFSAVEEAINAAK